MLFLLISNITKTVIEVEKRGNRSIFVFLKAIISGIIYKSSYPNISTGLPIYLLKNLLV